MMAELAAAIASNGPRLVLTSMMSDIQEVIAMGRGEDARKALNRVRYVVYDKLSPVAAIT